MVINSNSLRADLKQIIRDPILVLFSFLPLFIFIAIKILIVYVIPLLQNIIQIEISLYYGYILTVILLMTPGMLGTVIGFIMLDERDGNIVKLLITTPIGYSGYIINRLIIPSIGGVIYTFVGYLIINIYYLPIYILIIISLLISIEGVIIALSFYLFCEDKVKGLSFSKGLCIVDMLPLVDLLKIKWASILAGLLPFYWIGKIINTWNNPDSIIYILLGLFVHLLWLLVLIVGAKTKG